VSALIQLGNPAAAAKTDSVRPPTGAEKLLLTVAGVGWALFALALLSPSLFGSTVWAAPTIFGLVTMGTAGYFISVYRGTHPGIKNHGVFQMSLLNRGALGWATGVGFTTFYVALYWYGDSLRGGIELLEPFSQWLRGSPADQWFLYGFLYTLLVLVYGLRMLLKYRHNRYQLVRTGSVMFFQLGFAFLLPGVLKRVANNEFYFTYFWPLSPYSGWPDHFQADPQTWLGYVFLWWGVIALVVATPVLTFFYGKRWYCSWVCGCGGLAETLGDPWRQLSDKSEKAWRVERWMIHSVLVAVVVVTALLWGNDFVGGTWLGSSALFAKKMYVFVITMAFAGVIGVGFYPLMGSRVWCRFGCPMAAILGILQRFFSRFRISTNGGQCISCGNCSTYCEMGIDVRAYAQRGEDIVRASCVGCGVCSAVCPRGVLKLENGRFGDRFLGDGSPLRALGDALRGRPRS
jgi:Pyruvate/2-oxoacid:ferredoxin oxidoreductase delta subunit